MKKFHHLLTFLLAAHIGVASAQNTLEPATQLDELVVTASPFPRTLFEQAQPVTVLNGENLQLRLESTLGDTLNREAGITSTQFAPGASRPIIRGLGDDRIRVLSNGVNTTDVANVSPDHQVTTDPLTIDSIEVVRGPATLLYGPNTVGGVVNVIDNRIPTERLAKPVEGKVSGRFGTVDEERSGAFSFNFGAGPIVIHLDGFKRDTQDVHIPGLARSERMRKQQPLSEGEKEAQNVLPNSFVRSEGGAIGASTIWEGGFFGASYSGIDSNYGTVAEKDVTIDLRQRRLDVRGAFLEPLAIIKSINYKFAHTEYDHTEFEGPTPGTLFHIEGYDGRLDIVHQKLGPLEGAIGYQTQGSDFTAIGAEAFLPPTTNQTHSGFIFEEIAWEQYRFQFGARYDHQSNESDGGPAFGPGQKVDFNAISGSAGVVWTPVEAYAIALSVAYTERPPTYVELFANGPHVGTGSFEIGSAGLELERSVGVDFSVRKRLGRVTGAISLFYIRFTDYIALTPNGAFAPGEEEGEVGLPIFNYEAVDASYLGGEAEITFHLHEPAAPETIATGKNPTDAKSVAIVEPLRSIHLLDLEFKADYVRTEIRDGGDSLPRIPPFRVRGELQYSYNDRLRSSIGVQYVAEQNRTADFELPTDSYYLVNANLSYRVSMGPVEVDFYLKGTNLTNEEARLHTSFLKEVAPLPGRGVLFGATLEF